MPPPEHNVNGPPTSVAPHLRIKVHINYIIRKPRWYNTLDHLLLQELPLLASHIMQLLSTEADTRNKPSLDHCRSRTSLRWNLNKQVQYNLAIIETRGLLQRSTIIRWHISQ
jgi:hypothetical protein